MKSADRNLGHLDLMLTSSPSVERWRVSGIPESTPSVNNALHITAIVVDRTAQLQSCLMNHVGTGSCEHCLLSEFHNDSRDFIGGNLPESEKRWHTAVLNHSCRSITYRVTNVVDFLPEVIGEVVGRMLDSIDGFVDCRRPQTGDQSAFESGMFMVIVFVQFSR